LPAAQEAFLHYAYSSSLPRIARIYTNTAAASPQHLRLSALIRDHSCHWWFAPRAQIRAIRGSPKQKSKHRKLQFSTTNCSNSHKYRDRFPQHLRLSALIRDHSCHSWFTPQAQRGAFLCYAYRFRPNSAAVMLASIAWLIASWPPKCH
jgi:hypothetical protein